MRSSATFRESSTNLWGSIISLDRLSLYIYIYIYIYIYCNIILNEHLLVECFLCVALGLCNPTTSLEFLHRSDLVVFIKART
jgi:hypothetical protein